MPHSTLEARNAYSKAYYRANKAVINSRMVTINQRLRHDRYEEIVKLKSGPCLDCGNSFPSCVMDFDHRDPLLKVRDVSSMVKRMFAWPTVLAEIAKCDLVCVCCHRLRTYKGQNCYKTRRFEHHRAILDALKAETPCLDCGDFYQPCQMDFDHVTKDKVANIARLVGGPTEPLVAELRKCHIVCANCHRVRGETGKRPSNEDHGAWIEARFRELSVELHFPEDQRFVPFPHPELLGVVPDKELAVQTGISRPMVAWYRRKAGIQLTTKGHRRSSVTEARV